VALDCRKRVSHIGPLPPARGISRRSSLSVCDERPRPRRIRISRFNIRLFFFFDTVLGTNPEHYESVLVIVLSIAERVTDDATEVYARYHVSQASA